MHPKVFILFRKLVYPVLQTCNARRSQVTKHHSYTTILNEQRERTEKGLGEDSLDVMCIAWAPPRREDRRSEKGLGEDSLGVMCIAWAPPRREDRRREAAAGWWAPRRLPVPATFQSGHRCHRLPQFSSTRYVAAESRRPTSCCHFRARKRRSTPRAQWGRGKERRQAGFDVNPAWKPPST